MAPPPSEKPEQTGIISTIRERSRVIKVTRRQLSDVTLASSSPEHNSGFVQSSESGRYKLGRNLSEPESYFIGPKSYDTVCHIHLKKKKLSQLCITIIIVVVDTNLFEFLATWWCCHVRRQTRRLLVRFLACDLSVGVCQFLSSFCGRFSDIVRRNSAKMISCGLSVGLS